MAYELHYFPDNASLTIRMVLEELGLPYRARLVDRRRNDHRAEAYRRINPRGLIPALVDPDRGATLYETGAILLYLSETEGRLGPASDAPSARADFLKWLFLLSNTLHADLRLRYYSERFADDPTAAASVHRHAGTRVIDHFRLLDRAIGEAGSGWLLASGMSVCDPYLACCLRWSLLYPPASRMDANLLKDLPNLRQMVTELEQRPAIQQALRQEGIEGLAFSDPRQPDLGHLDE